VFSKEVSLDLVQDAFAREESFGERGELPGSVSAPEEVSLGHVLVANVVSSNNNKVVVFNTYENISVIKTIYFGDNLDLVTYETYQ
jgi:hypothetical protein